MPAIERFAMVAPARRGPPRHRGALVESMVCLALEIPQEGKIMRNGRATTRRPVTVVVAVITDPEDFQVPIPHQLRRYSSGHERSLISWNTSLSRSYV